MINNQCNIPISEIFGNTIQGEGRNTGKPSTFLRFFGCSHSCTWCDTRYSWDTTKYKPTMMSLKDIIEQIKALPSKHLIFTGGEPALFQRHIHDMQQELPGYTFELETNGAFELNKILVFDQINISPKLKSSGNKEYELKILKSPIITDFGNKVEVDLKFVCSTLQDFSEIELYKKSLVEYADYSKLLPVYIMPEGVTPESQNNKLVLAYCIKNGYNYCARSHVILFGNKKGV